MDLYIDKDVMEEAQRALFQQSERLGQIRSEISKLFILLRMEWDSEAGNIFVEKFEDDLIRNLERYETVLSYISSNLITASQKYDEVFRAADAVSSAQY